MLPRIVPKIKKEMGCLTDIAGRFSEKYYSQRWSKPKKLKTKACCEILVSEQLEFHQDR